MNTLFDYITHIKGVEYLVAIASILLFIGLWEVLKARPFGEWKDTLNDDIDHLKSEGSESVIKQIGRIAAAPFIGLAYIVALPFAFAVAIGLAVGKLAMKGAELALHTVGVEASFDWNPVEAYLTGRKKRRKNKKERKEK
jgi:hypothetical protein